MHMELAEWLVHWTPKLALRARCSTAVISRLSSELQSEQFVRACAVGANITIRLWLVSAKCIITSHKACVSADGDSDH